MKVAEVLKAMAGAYKNFDADAAMALAPAFVAKLERHEGPDLAAAWLEVVANFDPTARKPYPVPKDFEGVLPGRMAKLSSGPSLDFKGHDLRKQQLVEDWKTGQGVEISQKFGPRVFSWCEGEVRQKAGLAAWKENPGDIRLTQAQIEAVFQSVASRDRLEVFGASALREENPRRWIEQMDRCRAHVVAGRFSYQEEAQLLPPQPAAAKRVRAEVLGASSGPLPEAVYEDVPEGENYEC